MVVSRCRGIGPLSGIPSSGLFLLATDYVVIQRKEVKKEFIVRDRSTQPAENTKGGSRARNGQTYTQRGEEGVWSLR